MLIVHNLSYTHPNKEELFSNIDFSVNNQDKIALIGNNGIGKSTLLSIIAGELRANSGTIHQAAKTWYLPQIYGQFNHLNIAQALKIDKKLLALNAILRGSPDPEHFSILDDDWLLEVRCKEAFKHWHLNELDLSIKMEQLSGGQKTKVLLAGIHLHDLDLILMDEPSNHLDLESRRLLYDFILNTTKTCMVVSHDRSLLRLIQKVFELSCKGITVYGGNYDFYAEQKRIEKQSLQHSIFSREKALRKAREKERESIERQQKLDNRGKKKQEKSGMPRIVMNQMQNSAENSTSKLKSVHATKTGSIHQELTTLRSMQAGADTMKIGFDPATLHQGKILFRATDINFTYSGDPLWKAPLNFQLLSGERVAIMGANGSGKTTLIQLILGKLEPMEGTLFRAGAQSIYIDQDYSLINHRLTVYEQAQHFNQKALEEHVIKIRLSRFLFFKDDWDKTCGVLSGGERMRLLLCCLSIKSKSPDIIVLDEPTNNLDIQNIEILTSSVNEYQGTLLVISHDESFLEQVRIEKTIEL